MLRTALLSISLALALQSTAQSSSEKAAVRITATVQASSPAIVLNWASLSGTSSLNIFKKTKTATSWGSAVATPSASALTWTDNNVVVGTNYEYKIVRVAGGVTGIGYISTGIQLPVVDYRGKIILLVDNTLASSLSTELTQLTNDLRGDGWGVVRSDVSRTASVPSVKSIVQGHYNSDPANVKAVYIIGHVPVPYSGNVYPDGHDDARGARPTDGYYGDMDGNWTDNSVNVTVAGQQRTWNTPGDGKFDQSDFPSAIELQVGRVDMYDMPAFGTSEVELMRSYLNRSHNYKVKNWAPNNRAVLVDKLEWLGNPVGGSGWRASAMVGLSSPVPAAPVLDFKDYINGQSYLWTAHYGGGKQLMDGSVVTYNGTDGGTTTQELASTVSMGGVFNMALGSFFLDWDSRNNFLRAIIARGDGLTNCWAGIPAWYFHHMGMGDNIGVSVHQTMNNTGLYMPLTEGWQSSTGRTHLNLMGDPSLRMKMVKPPTNLVVTNSGGSAAFSWTASAEAVAGYHLFRIDASGGITRLTTSPVTTTSYANGAIPFVGGQQYMVRAVQLETSASGSYYNMSLGALATASGSSGSADCLGVVGGTATVGSACNDNNACTINDVYNVSCQCVGTSIVPLAVITPAGPTGFCSGGSVVLNASTGSGYSYVWKRNGTNISGATSSSYTATQAGTYSVTITNSGCSTSSANTTVTVGTAPAASVTATGATTFCAGGSVTLNGNTGTGLAYTWNRNGSAISGATGSSYAATQTGSYTLTVSNGGCSATSGAVNVTASAAPTATINAGGATSFCSGGSVALNATTGTGYTYVWLRNGSAISGATSSSYTANQAGTYSVTITNGGCSTTSANTTVAVGTAPAASITATGATTFCSGSSVTLNGNTGSGLTYTWNRNGSAISGATNSSYAASQAGSYTLTVSNGGCSSTSGAVNISVNAAPTATITAGSATSFCTGGSVALNATTGSGYAYVWRRDGSIISGATSSSYTANQAGAYLVTITSGGCSVTSAAVAVSITSAPTATITAAGSTTFCSGGSVVLNANTGSGYAYVWRRNGTAISGATSASYTATQAGSYTVVVSNGGCSATSSATTLTVGSGHTATITTSGSTSFCSGGSTVLNANTGSGFTYAWRRDGGIISGATSSSYTASVAGSYTVTITSGACSVTSSAVSIVVAAGAAATPVITALGPTSFCYGGNVILTTTQGSGLTYQWKLNGTPISGAATSFAYTAYQNGAITVTVSNGSCSATSAPLDIAVNMPPTASISASGATTFCAGGSVTLTGNTGSGFTYSWRRNGTTISGATASTYVATQAGSYTRTVSNGGCSTTSSAISVALGGSGLTPTITAGGATSFCSGGSVVLSTATGSGYTFVWRRDGTAISGATGSSYTASTAGSYTVSVSSGSCSGTSAATTVSVGTSPNAAITASGSTTFCAGGSVTFNASTGSGYTYVWYRGSTVISGATSSSYTATQAGSYAVDIQSSGCSKRSSSVTVTVNSAPTVSCTANASARTVSVSASGGLAPYTYSWNTSPAQSAATANVASTGSYTVVVTDARGCTASCTTSITIATGNSCAGIRTEAQSAWGATPSGNNVASYMASNFATAFPAPNYLTIGCGTRRLRLTTVAGVTSFLPSNGSSVRLPSGLSTNPTNYGNSLAGELVALKLSVRFDELNNAFSPASTLLKNMVIASGTFAGWTVQQLIDAADARLGNCGGYYGRTTLANAVAAVNNGYVGGTANSGYLQCPGSSAMVAEPSVEEVQDEINEVEALTEDAAAEEVTSAPEASTDPMTVQVFPNPVRSKAHFFIEGTTGSQQTTLEIHALNGTVVEQRQLGVLATGIPHRMEWDVEGIRSGVYLYRVISGDRIATGRIIVD